MPATVNLLWFGNISQFNSTPDSPATEAEADTLIGLHAVGPNQIEAVEIHGETRTVNVDGELVQAFATTYNAEHETTMSYVSPTTDSATDSVITGFFNVDYRLTLPDDSTVDQTGVLIQMANGDIFFRPALSTLSEWDGIDMLRAVTILDATPYPASTYAATISFAPDIFELVIDCFAVGTMILTDQGERRVEDLRPGDMIWTRDNGFQCLRWCAQRNLSADQLTTHPHLLPICIKAGALGPNQPRVDLTVSPQHRILIRSRIAQRMFCCPEILVAAKQLVELPGISTNKAATGASYVHLLLSRHEILMSNGAETESLYPGNMAMRALSAEAINEIMTLFPELQDRDHLPPPARALASGRRSRQLAARHLKNGSALQT